MIGVNHSWFGARKEKPVKAKKEFDLLHWIQVCIVVFCALFLMLALLDKAMPPSDEVKTSVSASGHAASSEFLMNVAGHKFHMVTVNGQQFLFNATSGGPLVPIADQGLIK